MTKPVNLNQFRKKQSRLDQKQAADENAARFGRTKAERILESTRSAKAAKMLDQHQLDDEG